MIQASKDQLHIILSRSLSGRLPGLAQTSNAVECNNRNALGNADVIHTRYATLFCCIKVTSRHHVMMRGVEWSVILHGLLTNLRRV
jgi:hypothetical protein